MAARSTECKICLERFETDHKRPRNLPCGHCFCSLCIHDLLKNGSLICPNCRAEHDLPVSGEFPIAYLVEDLMREMNISPDDSEQSIAVSVSKCHGGTLNKKVTSMRDEQVKSLLDLNESVKVIMSNMATYKEMLKDWDAEHGELIARVMETLVNQNKETQQRLKKDQVIVEDFLCEGREKQQLLQSAVDSLVVASTTQEVVAAVDVSDHCQVHLEDWVQRSKENLSYYSVAQSAKVRTSTSNALDIIDTDLSDEKIRQLLEGVKNYSIERKVQLVEELATVKVTAQSLCKYDEPVSLLLENELIYAVHEDKAKGPRFAKITHQNGYIYLHHLASDPPPRYSHILKYEEVVGLQDPTSTLTFLELVWPNSPAFKVHIRLSPNTRRAEQFALLCKGVIGPSYANTHLLGVFKTGEHGESIEAGDYDKIGGAAIMTNLTLDKDCDIDAGIVSGYGNSDPRENEKHGSLFYIWTKAEPEYVCNTVFGRVERGLEEIQVEKVKDGVISDCGLVIPINHKSCSTSCPPPMVVN